MVRTRRARALLASGAAVALVTAAAGLLAFRMSWAIALEYRRMAWLIAALSPGVAMGLAQLALGRPGAGPAAGVGSGSVLLALGSAARFTSRRPPGAAGWSPPRGRSPRREAADAPRVATTLKRLPRHELA